MKPFFLKNFSPGAAKYQNKKIQVDGITFDSKKEANVYAELKLLLAAGEIEKFDRQVKFILVPSQYEVVDGKKKNVELPVTYICDFVVYHKDGEKTVIDAKGMKTPAYVIKRKLMLSVFGLRIKEV